MRGALDRWYRFYDGYNPSFSWWTRNPHEKANRELESYTKLLRERVASLTDQPLTAEFTTVWRFAGDISATREAAAPPH